MKAWFKILSGKTTSTPAEIAGEIDNLKVEQNEVKAKLSETQEALSKARMELYGGSGNQSNVDGLESDVKALQIQADTLSRAIADLGTKHGEAVELEKQAQVKAIDKKITDLRQWMADIRPEYVKAKMTFEAYEKLFTAPLMGVGMQSREALAITGKERAAYAADVEAITKGHGSIMGEVLELQRQKENILKG
jgi:chromosome segregation ATPase